MCIIYYIHTHTHAYMHARACTHTDKVGLVRWVYELVTVSYRQLFR